MSKIPSSSENKKASLELSESPNLINYTVNELKSVLRENNNKVSGIKADLIQRIKNNNISKEDIYKLVESTHRKTKTPSVKRGTRKKVPRKTSFESIVEAVAEEEADQMLEKIQGHIEPETCSLSTRRNTDYNFFELVFALCALDKEHKLKNKADIKKVKYEDVKNKIIGCNEVCFGKYMNDGNKSDATINRVNNHVTNMRKNFHIYVPGGFDEVKCVYLEGKILTTPKLKKLNEGVDTKKAKSDVYIETNKGTIVGFSLKQDDKCTMTNYSTEKMLGELFDENVGKTIQENLKQARLKILSENNITKTNYREVRDQLDPATGNKFIHNKINSLFYDSLEGKNAYWSALKHYIDENSQRISREIVDNMFPVDLQYNLYQFNGKEYMKLNVPTNIEDFKDHVRFYYEKPTQANIKKGDLQVKRRVAAKMFYKMVVNGMHFRIEIRFKNPIISSSPQFQVHKDHERTPSPENDAKRKFQGSQSTRVHKKTRKLRK